MRYAVVINLDYASYPELDVHRIWRDISRAMEQAGFRRDGRRFTVDLPVAEASRLAYRTMDHLASCLEREGRHLYSYIREFYGYPVACADNLMVPPLDGLEVHVGVPPREADGG